MTDVDEDRRRLAAALHRLRLDSGLSTTALGERLGWSQSKVSKTELARTLPKPEDVAAWADATGAEASLRADLVAMAERAGYQATETRRVLAPGRRKNQEEVQRLEAAASVIRVFAPVLVVGLAQTYAYADAVFRIGRRVGLAGEPRDEVVRARLARQGVLDDTTKRFHLLMGEAALRRRLVRPAGMCEQLNRLIELSERDNVTVGVIPFDTEESAHQYHGFSITGDPESDEDCSVSVVTLTRVVTVRSHDEVAEYVAHFETLRSAALEGATLRAFLRGLIAEYEPGRRRAGRDARR